MGASDPKVEEFFSGARNWRDELLALRSILLDTPLTEEFKWRSPCYTFQGGNVATIWGFKDNPVLGFFKGVLLTDPENILMAPGENSRSSRIIKFSGLAEISAMNAIVRQYVLKAIEIEQSGLKVDFPKDDLALPSELQDRLNEDPELSAAFHALTPGRRRGYILHFSQPKQAATRSSRIDKCAPRILAGKGMHDR